MDRNLDDTQPWSVPDGFRARQPRWDDLEHVAALYAQVSRSRVGFVTVRRDDLRLRWAGLDSLHDAVLVEHPAASIPVAFASFEPGVDPWTGAVDLHVDGRVHTAWTGHGLASFLLARADQRAREHAHAIGAERVVVHTTVDDGDDAARAFFAHRGFEPVRHLLELHLDLHAPPPAPRWPDGIHCRTFEPGRDEPVAWRAHQDAFADVATAMPIALDDWVEERIGRDPAFDPGLVLLAEHDREVVALAVCRAGGGVGSEDGWVRDLGVVPGWRRRGIAMALLRTAFAAFRARGLTGAALEVDDVTLEGAVALYRRAGMRVTRRTDVVERHLDVAAGAGR